MCIRDREGRKKKKEVKIRKGSGGKNEDAVNTSTRVHVDKKKEDNKKKARKKVEEDEE